MELNSKCENSNTEIRKDMKVLVFSKHQGIVRYVPSTADDSDLLYGIELRRPFGNTDGKKNGEVYFTCQPNYGIFTTKKNLLTYSIQIEASCTIQNVWRKWLALKCFRSLLNSSTWNLLDNNQEQLHLKRGEQIKSTEQTLSMLINKTKINQPRDGESFDEINSGYDGVHLTWPLSLENVLKILESFKSSKLLHHRYVSEILLKARKVFASMNTLQEITISENECITIVGDLHGQLSDLYSIFSINGIPSKTNKYLFNGDFVDRGNCGVEVVVSILLFKLLYPDAIYMNRGNHESRNQNSWMGFDDEIWSKYDGTFDSDSNRANHILDLFQRFFESLPLCAVIQEKIFVVHGGLSSRDGVTLTHLNAISRKREPPLHQSGFEDKVFEDLLWSDPRNISGRQPSERGAGVEFGVDVTNSFCGTNRIALVVRSHECVPEGFEVLHGGRLITLFSASRYCGTQTNKGAFLKMGIDLQPEIQQFYAQPMLESDFKSSVKDEVIQETLEEDNVRMIVERICDLRSSLLWYFTQQDQNCNGYVTKLVWSEALRSVLQLDLPFLNYQKSLVDVEDDNTINYTKFLSRYRIENPIMDSSGWAEEIIRNICKKLYTAMGSGSMEQAFQVFDADSNGFIEYDEFMDTLKSLDTGLSDQQVYELMRVSDSNEDGRIDFREFAQRFEVIFEEKTSNKMDIDDSSTGTTHAQKNKLIRRFSDQEKSMNPVSVKDVDSITMAALLEIGNLMIKTGDSLLKLFHQFDTNNDGVLQEEEFSSAIDKMGIKIKPEVLRSVMKAVDTDGGNTIDYKEFFDAFCVRDRNEPNEIEKGNTTWQQSVLHQMANLFYQHRIHLRSIFRILDADRTGYINISEFRTGIRSFNNILNSPLTDDQIEELLKILDKNADGVLSYEEFFDGFRVVDYRKVDSA